jgi:hypothetical protein
VILKDKRLLGLLEDKSLINIKFKKFFKESAFKLRLLALLNIKDDINLETF